MTVNDYAKNNRMTAAQRADYFDRDAEDARFAALDKRIEELEALNFEELKAAGAL